MSPARPAVAGWLAVGTAVLALSGGCGPVVEEPPVEGTPKIEPAADCLHQPAAFVLAAEVPPFEHRQPTPIPGSHKRAFDREIAGGLAAGDFDGDGFDDLFVTQLVGPSAILWGDGEGAFPARSDGPDGPLLLAAPWDADADGRPEVLTAGPGRLRLVRADEGRSVQSDDLDRYTIAGQPGALGIADWDLDSDLDLYVGGYLLRVDPGDPFLPVPGPDRLLRFDGWMSDGPSWVDSTTTRPPAEDGATLHALFRDLDGDGGPELIEVHDFGDLVPTRLWGHGGVEDGGSPRWIGGDSPFGPVGSPMGAAVEDFDGDGTLDVVFSNLGLPTAYRGVGAEGWVDTSLAWLSSLPDVAGDASWSVIPLDVGADGRPDLFFSYGPLEPEHTTGPAPAVSFQSRLVRNTVDEHAEIDLRWDPAAVPDWGPWGARGVVVGDWNGDAVADLAVARLGAAPAILLGTCPQGGRLRIDLRQPGTRNPLAVGAELRVTVDGWTRRQVVSASGPGTFSGGGSAIFVGTGGAAEIDVEVRWPGGSWVRYAALPSASTVRIERPLP